MGFFDLDSDRIVRIFHANGLKMSLNKAFRVSNIIYTAHLERLNEVEVNSFNVGKAEGLLELDRKCEDTYQQGYAKGLRDACSDLNERVVLDIVNGTAYARASFDAQNMTMRIQCIKHLRKHFPLLSLRQAKTIVDQCDGLGHGVCL